MAAGKGGAGKGGGKAPRSPRSSKAGASGNITGRGLAEQVKSAKGRKISSTRWLQRQLNDPYVAEAKRRGFRSRAAFKLLELDDKYNLLGAGKRVVDLGAAPGGWSQVAVERCRGGRVVALDQSEMEAIAGVEILTLDFLEDVAPAQLMAALGGPADVVLSDLAPSATGHASTDHIRIMAILELAIDFAEEALAPDGAFIGKALRGGTEDALLNRLKKRFKTVRHAKPPSSRADSREMYVVATGFRPPEE